jgi:lipopolysaccharide biosynthesis glycosyltransferase
MKICIVTAFDRNYKLAGQILFKSIRRYTDCTGIDFKVITADEEVLNELGKDNCHFVTDEIKARYSNVKYCESLTVEKYSTSWYRYEIFSMTDYDRVICIDSDCICIKDISYLFSEELNQYDLISVEDHIVSKFFAKSIPQLEGHGFHLAKLTERLAEGKIDIQPALLVANKSIVNKTWYNNLLKYANTAPYSYSIDQGTLNNFIYTENIKIKLLPLEWDYQDLYAIRCSQLPEVDPIIVHCQESKPFKRLRKEVDGRIQKFHDQWWDEYNYSGVLKTNVRINGKICITTVFDRRYKVAGRTLFNSIKRHTDCTGIDFKVITDDMEVVNDLGADNCHIVTSEIKARYADVKYINDLPKEKYASSWYRYEMFNFEGYDRVICIDSDCICLEDISYLFSEELSKYDLISTEDMIVSRIFKKNTFALEKNYGLRLQGLRKRIADGKIDIQPALLVANQKIVNNQWYQRLLEYANKSDFTYSIDEGILNDFIYADKIKIKILPMEWNYMDTYGAQIPELPVPDKPFIVHCQESKPFKNDKKNVNSKIHKWYDLWLKESRPISKTIVVIIVWNRFENLKRWINCWNQCDKLWAELIVVHNQESDNHKYLKLCVDNGVKYVARENVGFDLGAFQDVCKERLTDFPNDWDNLIWITDDCIPMSKNFVASFLDILSDVNIPCYEISREVKPHIRTTGFLVTKEISKKLIFPSDPMHTREDCYQFEHKSKNAFYEQVVRMGKRPTMIATDLKQSSLWDIGVRRHLNLMKKHEEVFPPEKYEINELVVDSVLDNMAILHKSDKSSRYHNYAVKYERILSPFRNSFLSILEIGVAQGQSIKMWADYFPKATIYGADISPASKICESYSNRIKFHLLDQRDEAQLKNLEQFSPFDLIIDDGNHYWMEQILTFKTLFPYLKDGGIYIVEDTTTSYWEEYKNNPISAVEYFKTLVDEVHLKGARGSMPVNPPQEFGDLSKGWHRREDCHVNVPLFESIQFMNGFIVIYKRIKTIQPQPQIQKQIQKQPKIQAQSQVQVKVNEKQRILHAVCTVYGTPVQVKEFIDNFLIQSNPNWTLQIIYDGIPPQDMMDTFSLYKDSRVHFIFSQRITQKHIIHPNRQMILQQLKCEKDDFVLITNNERCYNSEFVEHIMTGIGNNGVGIVYGGNKIDMGTFMVRADIAKMVGDQGVNDFANGIYATECRRYCNNRNLELKHIEEPLFIP